MISGATIIPQVQHCVAMATDVQIEGGVTDDYGGNRNHVIGVK